MIDTIIVGAGPSGLCAARTIIQCDPNAEVVVLDAASSIGGVWGESKIYDGLHTNHHFGGLDFSDLAMTASRGCTPGSHIPGEAVNSFLKKYAQKWNLMDKIRLNTKVVEAIRLHDRSGWELKILSPDENLIQCRKLIIAIGINNSPHRPKIEGETDFAAPILHSSELGMHAKSLFTNEKVETVAVLGGGKSAYDAVQLASSTGKEVEWIIRKSGKGPVWVFPLLTKLGPFEAQRDKLPVRRFISFFSPCIWDDGFTWIRKFLHGTRLGKFIAQLFWAQLHADTLRDCRFREHESTKVLEPEQSPFWYGTTAGACSYGPILFERIRRGQVRVYREDIDHLSDRTIHLANGHDLKADVLVTATGFSAKPTISFFPNESHSELGIPTTKLTKDQEDFWAKLDMQSDLNIATEFPRLLGGPFRDPKSQTPKPFNPGLDPEANYSPSRLYRSIAPPGLTEQGDRSLVFLGVFSNFANHARLEIQCLWAYAYLNNKLAIDTKSVYQEASMLSRFSRHRTPFGHGRYFPDHVFDQLPYFDVLLRDLGLSTMRKNNMFAEIFEPYTVADYRGIVQEWLIKTCKKG